MEIEFLEDRNLELEEAIKALEHECVKSKDEFERYRNQQK
jgi:hypothetical protein